MLMFIFVILMFGIFGKMLALSVRAAWGVSKILLSLVLLPIMLVVSVIVGLISFAIPILLIIGAVLFFGRPRA